jgi:hypothetical protein
LPEQFGIESRAGPAGRRSPVARLAHPLRRGAPGIDRHGDWRFHRKLHDFRLFCGITHQTTQILPANCASFCTLYL